MGLDATAGIRAVEGQYTISQLKQWTDLAISVLELPGVTMVDLDEARNRVAVGLEDDSRMQAVVEALERLRIPAAAVEVRVSGKIRPLVAR